MTNQLKRVVVTGMGIVSCIGNNQDEVVVSLKEGKSGIVFAEKYAEMGFRSHVHGQPNIDIAAHVDKRVLRFMGEGAAYNYIAMEQAINDAGLEKSDVSNERTGLIMGSGGPSTGNLIDAAAIAQEKGPKRIGPFMVPRTMSSTNSATLATPFEIKGSNLNNINYKSPVSSAQVKSCILIAGAYADGVTTITEPSKSRDHTERMMKAMGAKIEITDNKI